MASPEAIARVNRAKEEMMNAEFELRAYLERPDRGYTPEEFQRCRELVARLKRTIDAYMRAFAKACKS